MFQIRPRLRLLLLIALFPLSLALASDDATSILEIIQPGDIVFTGTLTEIKSLKREYLDRPYASHPEKEVTVRRLFTSYRFEEIEVLRGSVFQPSIDIQKSGGFDAYSLISNSRDYFLRLDQQYLVIAAPSKIFENTWVARNGRSGVFDLIEKGNLRFIKNTLAGETIHTESDPAPEKIEFTVFRSALADY